MILRKERLNEVCNRSHPKNIEQREITLLTFPAVHLWDSGNVIFLYNVICYLKTVLEPDTLTFRCKERRPSCSRIYTADVCGSKSRP